MDINKYLLKKFGNFLWISLGLMCGYFVIDCISNLAINHSIGDLVQFASGIVLALFMLIPEIVVFRKGVKKARFSKSIFVLNIIEIVFCISSFFYIFMGIRSRYSPIPYWITLTFALILTILATIISVFAILRAIYARKLYKAFKKGALDFSVLKKEPKSKGDKHKTKLKKIEIKPFKQWFYMNNLKAIFFPIAGFITLFSIFCMFGSAIKLEALGIAEYSKYSLIQAAFGIGESIMGGSSYKVLPSPGIIILFILLIALAIMTIIDFVKEKKLNKKYYIYHGVKAGLTLVALILAFCSSKLVNDTSLEGQMVEIPVKNGTGPILVGVFNIIALFTICAGFVFNMYQYSKSTSLSHPKNESVSHKPLTKIVENAKKESVKQKVKPEEVKNTDSDFETKEQNINLLVKYKKLYDDGVITKEEFEAKKKELL